MSNDRKPFIKQSAKAALITSVAVALMLPGGLAAAADSSSSVTVQAAPASAAQTPDPAEAKITQEQAVAKLKALFPVLKDATVSNTQLGSGNSYPLNPNQLVWNIQWNYQIGSSGYGFSSEVDAMTGDLISTYLYFPFAGQTDNFYPPKVSRAEALEKAKSFVSQAVPTLKSSDLQLDENVIANDSALFGPVQYSFYFNLLVNGLPSSSDSVRVTVDGSGNVMQFNKSTSGLKYPSAKPAVTQAQAEKTFKDSFDVALYYTPVFKKGEVDSWVLSWRPQNEVLYPIDAQTGKRVDNEGSDASAPVVYEAVPAGKDIFKPVTSGKELTVDEAVKQVQKVAAIPANRKLIWQTLSTNYQNSKQKVWTLAWGDTAENAFSGIPGRTYAEVNATTGEVLQFQLEQYNYPLETTQQTTAAPAGSKKLSQAEAKQQALSLINRLYDQASSSLKLAEHGGNWSVLPNDKGFRFEFLRYFDGFPVSESTIMVTLDLYGKLQTYANYGAASFSKITKQPAPVVTKAEALQKYLNLYTLKLQYGTTGGFFSTTGGYTDLKVRLVYSPALVDTTKPFEALNAQTGNWFSLYDYNLIGQNVAAASAVDIKGHAAEKQLTELLKYGVITPDADGKVNPDQVITVGDWLGYIAKASTPYYTSYSTGLDSQTVAGVSPDSPYYKAVNYSVSRSWLDKDKVVKPEESLTREQLAVLLASFLKYSKLSSFLDNDATVTSFSDSASVTNKGAVALVVRLGLLQGENGKFNPQQHVTKAQAAAVIMKLVELQGKTDTAIGQQYM